jgi:hypothetical protein
VNGSQALFSWLLENMTCAPPARAGPLSVTVQVGERPPATLERLRLSEERRVGRVEDYCSKIKTAGFGSLNETTTNFDVETA